MLTEEIESDLAEFRHLLEEWHTLCASERNEVAAWEGAFRRMLDAQRVLVERGIWISGPEDFLSIVARARDELCHSHFLAWLLGLSRREAEGRGLLGGLGGVQDAVALKP